MRDFRISELEEVAAFDDVKAEKELWLAVILRAITDYVYLYKEEDRNVPVIESFVGLSHKEDIRSVFRSARYFLFSDDQKTLFSFHRLTNDLFSDPIHARESIRRFCIEKRGTKTMTYTNKENAITFFTKR